MQVKQSLQNLVLTKNPMLGTGFKDIIKSYFLINLVDNSIPFMVRI